MGKIESDLLISLEIYGSNNNFLSYYSIFNYNFELWFPYKRAFETNGQHNEPFIDFKPSFG